MKAFSFEKQGGPLNLVKLDIPTPGQGQVRIKVHACGLCHSDVITQNNSLRGGFPRVPGHEVAGVVDEVGPGVDTLAKGDRVGVGWFGKNCKKCRNCVHHKQPVNCTTMQATGAHHDGGYAEFLVANSEACAKIPDALSFVDACPLMCAGVTTYNSLRNSPAKPGDTVVVVGVGGLGHLGVQFASKMGFRTVAVSRDSDKKELATKLGALHYIDTSKQSVKDELLKLGGAKVVLWTSTTGAGIDDYLQSLDLGGQVIILAAIMSPVSANTLPLIGNNGGIRGWSSGDAQDSQDTLDFAVLTGVRPIIEKFSFAKAEQAYERMLTSKAQFRVVLEF